ncbi:MAG: hypothetical protein WD875_08330 [Pirellulales bacterium]
MSDNPFESPQVDLTLPDGPPAAMAYGGRLTLASFGARSGGKIGALFGLVGGAALSGVLGAIHASVELGGRPSGMGIELVLAGAVLGAVFSCVLGAIVGAWLGGVCERRPGLIGRGAMLLGGIASAIGAATFTGIAAGLLFDGEPFSEAPRAGEWIAGCAAFGAVLGFIGGAISGRRIGEYDRWRRSLAPPPD